MSPVRRIRCSPSHTGVKSWPSPVPKSLEEGSVLATWQRNLHYPAGTKTLQSGATWVREKGRRKHQLITSPASLVTAWDTGTSYCHSCSQELPGDLNPFSKILTFTKPSLRYQGVLEAPLFSPLGFISPNLAFAQAQGLLRLYWADVLCIYVIPKFRSEHVLKVCAGRYSQQMAGEESWVKGTAVKAVLSSNASKGDAFPLPSSTLWVRNESTQSWCEKLIFIFVLTFEGFEPMLPLLRRGPAYLSGAHL